MKVSRLIIYPIKSLRGIDITSSKATKTGFSYDRCFMLIKDEGESVSDPSKRYRNMTVSKFNHMCRFFTEIHLPEESQPGSITVTHKPVEAGMEASSINIPLEPDVHELETMEMIMYRSGTTCYKMPKEFNDWFSVCFGFDVYLVHVGTNFRPVLFSLDPLPPLSAPSEADSDSETSVADSGANQSWLNYFSGGHLGSSATAVVSNSAAGTTRIEKITFADMAPFLIVSETSLNEVSQRLPTGQPMDITKFRPNIVLSGAEEAWEEDFWGELSFASQSATLKEARSAIRLMTERNCVRCRSINIDYSTGKQGTNEFGKILALLQKDRRVDVGSKYSPVFGRYSFLASGDGETISIGDEVFVERRNTERAVLDWHF